MDRVVYRVFVASKRFQYIFLIPALLCAVAWGAELSGVVPCALCRVERNLFGVGAALGMVFAGRLRGLQSVFWAGLALLCTYHVGLQMRWWTMMPAFCKTPAATTNAVETTELLLKTPACDQVTATFLNAPLSVWAAGLAWILCLWSWRRLRKERLQSRSTFEVNW